MNKHQLIFGIFCLAGLLVAGYGYDTHYKWLMGAGALLICMGFAYMAKKHLEK